MAIQMNATEQYLPLMSIALSKELSNFVNSLKKKSLSAQSYSAELSRGSVYCSVYKSWSVIIYVKAKQ